MKRVLTVFLILFLLVGCNNNKESKPEDKKEQIKYLTKMEMNEKLFGYATEIYNSKTYTKVEKTNGEYFISLKNLKEKYNYDISMFLNPTTHEKCDQEKTGVSFDIDNVRNLEYKDAPILIMIYCD
ncbi:MAG: hypothetical protein ACI32H_04865 [Bacilli bacterium]